MSNKIVTMAVSEKTISLSRNLMQRLIYRGIIVTIKNGQATVVNCDDGASVELVTPSKNSKHNIERKAENYGTYELIEVERGLFKGKLVDTKINLSKAKKLSKHCKAPSKDLHLIKYSVSITKKMANKLGYVLGDRFIVEFFEKDNLLVFMKTQSLGIKLQRNPAGGSRLYLPTRYISDFFSKNKDYTVYTDSEYIIIKGM